MKVETQENLTLNNSNTTALITYNTFMNCTKEENFKEEMPEDYKEKCKLRTITFDEVDEYDFSKRIY